MEKKDVQEIFDLYVEVLKKKLREANTPLMDLNDGIRTIDRLDRMLVVKSSAEQGYVGKALQEGIEKARVPYD